jgi:hypothetical protein
MQKMKQNTCKGDKMHKGQNKLNSWENMRKSTKKEKSEEKNERKRKVMRRLGKKVILKPVG